MSSVKSELIFAILEARGFFPYFYNFVLEKFALRARVDNPGREIYGHDLEKIPIYRYHGDGPAHRNTHGHEYF